MLHHIRHLECFWIDLANKMPQLMVVDVLAMKNKKGKNFVLEKEWPLFYNFLHVSRNPTIGTRQRSTSFWGWIWEPYNQNWLFCCVEQPRRSFETKWVTQHNITKFVGHYEAMVALCEYGFSIEVVLHKVLKLLKTKDPNNQNFVFIHYYLTTIGCS